MIVDRITTADVRDALTVEAVIDRYGLHAQKRGSQYRLKQCPRCGEKSSREAIAIDARTGSWLHHGFEHDAGGQCSGDIIDLVAACEGLDCHRDFRRIMAIAAELAGVSSGLSDVERDIRDLQIHERVRQEAVAEVERRVASRNTAGAAWDALPRIDRHATAYLTSRGLDANRLIDLDAVRCASDGIAVAIRDADGFPISIARRLYEPGDRPKVLALKDHSTRGSMIDAVSQISHERDVVIVEGVVDALTARLAWPSAIVLGANGAGNIPKLAEAAISRVKLAGCRLSFIPHDDVQGIRATTAAAQTAIAAGLELGITLQIVEITHKDLNDAWCAGWRP